MTQQIAVREEASSEQHQPSAQNTTAIAQHFVKSGYFQDATDVSKAVVKILAGQEIGIGPFAAMTGINVIKGRITLSANLIAAQIKRSNRYNFHVTEHTDLRCAIDFFEGDINVGESSFSMDDAKKAGLAGGDNWRNYPRNMLFARAISNGAKWYCPDVFGGSPVYTPDELDAPVDPQTGEIIQPAVNQAAPKDNRYWCDEHKTAWFKRGKMKSYAHPPTGPEGSPWCYMADARLDAKDNRDQPQESSPEAQGAPPEPVPPLNVTRHSGKDITAQEWQSLYNWAAEKYGIEKPEDVHMILGKSSAEWTGTLRDAAALVVAAQEQAAKVR